MLFMSAVTIYAIVAAYQLKTKIEEYEQQAKELQQKINQIATPAAVAVGLGSYLLSRVRKLFK